mmetsp:Transcript_72299/g.224281  ORF Transcript_72299/g.224281 Transcript_72299/m.224281 type:complete len:97 (-) Transcript_72299:15-305(-)
MRPLHFAASTGSSEACQVLIAYGADTGARDDEGRLALDHVPSYDVSTQQERRYWSTVLKAAGPLRDGDAGPQQQQRPAAGRDQAQPVAAAEVAPDA